MVKKINDKPWYMSKTIWTAIVTAVLTILMAFGVKIPVELLTALVAVGLYSARIGVKPIQNIKK